MRMTLAGRPRWPFARGGRCRAPPWFTFDEAEDAALLTQGDRLVAEIALADVTGGAGVVDDPPVAVTYTAAIQETKTPG